MKKLFYLSLTTIIIMQLVISPAAFAANNIKLFGMQDSQKEVVVQQGEKKFLKQDWYGMKFEINPAKKLGIRELKEVDKVEFEKALDEVSFFNGSSVAENVYESVYCSVYFLDSKLIGYSNTMALSFKDNSIVVFGNYWNLGKDKIHQLAVHELGHQVDFQLMNEQSWNTYKKLRGIENQSIYNNNSEIHSNRPQEIFAEDFRMIFGGKTAKQVPHINKLLDDPNKEQRLKEFFLNLIRVK